MSGHQIQRIQYLGFGLPALHLVSMLEAGNAVVWLCSDAASCITADTMTVDGGYVVQ
jgi:enoyl-[acyl-carrier-protein] reductase (NADH)